MSSTLSGRYMDFMEGAGESFVASGGGTPSITPEDIDVVGFAGPLNGGSRSTPSITPEDMGVVGFGGPIGGSTSIISKKDMGVGGFANVGSMLPNPEIEMISALGQIAARGQYGELLNAVKDMPANIAGVTDAISNGDMRALGSTVANAVFAAAGAKAKTGMAQGALAAAKNFISPKNVEATAAAQARMPSMAMSFGAAPNTNLSAADKAKAALEASKRSAAQPIALGAVAGCGAAAESTSRPSEAEIESARRKLRRMDSITQFQNELYPVIGKAKGTLQVVRDGNSITLMARVPTYGSRALEWGADVESRWDGLAYTDADGTTYKTDIKIIEEKNKDDAVISLDWVDSDERNRSTSTIGVVEMDKSQNFPVIESGVPAHEFGHAYFGLKDGYTDFKMPNGYWVYGAERPGMEGSIMANHRNGIVREKDLKALIGVYDKKLNQ